VIGASVFMARREIFFVASAAAILFGSLLDLQYYGYLPSLPAWAVQPQLDIREVFFAVFVNVTAIFFTALLSGILVERLLRSEQELEKKKSITKTRNLNRTIWPVSAAA
jgi:two-component system sensor histidine kinase PilS (NtrC family)